MASQRHPGNTYNAEHDTNQAQMRRNNLVDQPSDIHNQGQATNFLQEMRRNDLVDQPSDIHNQAQTNFLQESGAQAKNVAQNAVGMAKGAAVGAASMAQGAAAAVKNTLGMNASDPTSARSGGLTSPRNTSHPSNTTTKM
ncbi:hypothetical protein C2S52_014982 [Perilla frutescens var. hirtella]|nr:hypothetical protein C2S52_014982 [Perilla frutescens var. hirtella]KAH6816197.1 hypothetical protein C2S51_021017 [Perilla frutescens var. frutescens]